MAEGRPRTLKVLEALSKMTEPSSPADIGITIEVSPRDTGKTLYDLGKGGLAQKPDDKKSLRLITDKGRKYIENPPVLSERPLEPTLEPTTQADLAEEVLTVPSQSDLFKSIGERLGVGTKKGDIRLEAITYYVQRTANLDNLSSVWNALTEMGVANDVKKRWIKIYAQSIPGKEIPEELKEKLETGQHYCNPRGYYMAVKWWAQLWSTRRGNYMLWTMRASSSFDILANSDTRLLGGYRPKHLAGCGWFFNMK